MRTLKTLGSLALIGACAGAVAAICLVERLEQALTDAVIGASDA